MSSAKQSSRLPEARLRQLELGLSICKDTLRAISANGDLDSSRNARKALNTVESTFRRANV